jgi:hypothetical protein
MSQIKELWAKKIKEQAAQIHSTIHFINTALITVIPPALFLNQVLLALSQPGMGFKTIHRVAGSLGETNGQADNYRAGAGFKPADQDKPHGSLQNASLN